jgi:hypothetical protein
VCLQQPGGVEVDVHWLPLVSDRPPDGGPLSNTCFKLCCLGESVKEPYVRLNTNTNYLNMSTKEVSHAANRTAEA